MIVNHDSKVIIFGNRKCASTSLMQLFAPLQQMPETFEKNSERWGEAVLPDDVRAILADTWPKHFNVYQSARLFAALGYDWDEYVKVIAIRNPWDRMLSHYTWFLKRRFGSDFTSPREFEGYLSTRTGFVSNSLAAFTGCYDGRYEDHNVVIVTVENLDEDLGRVWSLVDPLESPERDVPVLNAAPRQLDYREVYTDRSREIVGFHFASDVNFGGYKF